MKLATEIEITRGAIRYAFAELIGPTSESFLKRVRKIFLNYFELRRVAMVQDAYDTKAFTSAEKVVVVLIPGEIPINGGVMSFYNIAKTTRKLYPSYFVVVCTFPASAKLYSQNTYFPNEEFVWRWGLVARNLGRTKSVLIHLPEYCVHKLCRDISWKERMILSRHENIQINVLNQNIWMMPDRTEIDNLKKIVLNVTETTAHKRYATQDMSNEHGLPLSWLGTYLDFSGYRRYPFADKEKIIVLSPDPHPEKENIVAIMKEGLPEFKFRVVENMRYTEYIDLISKAYFTVTFGEGWDGYFTQPHYMGSIGFAVYQKDFFPKDFECEGKCQIFMSYDEMKREIVPCMKRLLADERAYTAASALFTMSDKSLKEAYESRIKALYSNTFDFYPQNDI